MLAKATSTKSQAAKVTEPLVTREDIARRSYEIFLERGGEHGHDLEHWIQAERDLSA
jgi:hypothetical protein